MSLKEEKKQVIISRLRTNYSCWVKVRCRDGVLTTRHIFSPATSPRFSGPECELGGRSTAFSGLRLRDGASHLTDRKKEKKMERIAIKNKFEICFMFTPEPLTSKSHTVCQTSTSNTFRPLDPCRQGVAVERFEVVPIIVVMLLLLLLLLLLLSIVKLHSQLIE
ncbi:hypothetical protein PoB_006505000 [Plakobranchus ocellatus]|uniref:Uncharacterized protein n=1 Tax=Plakobranchus ocellatus TaxID=259542 RepID=A0AAV4D334_9GAST|nr:hypothetical protein PoB_006505000 [Plakobranchus ocellatus]